MKNRVSMITGIAATLVLAICQNSVAQDAAGIPLKGYFGVRPWDGGTAQDAATQAAAGTTVPLSFYNFPATKNGATYPGIIVGTSPFANPLTGSVTIVSVIPLIVTIGTTTFDPTAPNSCDSNVSAVTRLLNSPIVQNSPSLTFNGQNVGTNLQYTNGFRRAEFWSLINGDPTYSNSLSFTTGPPVTLPASFVGTHGKVFGSGCTQLGMLSNSWLDKQLMQYALPILRNYGFISTNQFVVFLLRNVVQSTTDPPNILTCCILGYHGAVGNPVQTYSPMDWDTTRLFPGILDGSIAAHETAEWMDDPLGINPTPAWGNVGQVLGCQSNFEVADALTGKNMPVITMNGFGYHMQELAFFSWFFNSVATPSLGAGGKFSGNGTFSGPAKACPPGGTN